MYKKSLITAFIFTFLLTITVYGQEQYKNVSLNGIPVVIEKDGSKLYIPLIYALHNEVDLCNQKYKLKEKGLTLAHFELKKDKKNKFSISECEILDYLPPKYVDNTKQITEDMDYKEKAAIYVGNAQNEFYKILLSNRKQEPIRQGQFGRLYLNTSSVYVADDRFGRKVFIKPEEDIGLLEQKVKNVKEIKEWYTNYIKLEEQKQNEEVEESLNEEVTNS